MNSHLQANRRLWLGRIAHEPEGTYRHGTGGWLGVALISRHNLQLHLAALEHHAQLPLGPVLAAGGGRFYAAPLGPDTVILDVQLERFSVFPEASPREFEVRTEAGQTRTVLMVEGDGSRNHPYPPWSDLEWLMLEDWPPERWTFLSAILPS